MFRFLRKSNPLLLQHKLDLIDFAFPLYNVRSFADLGGVWRVEGGYTFYALDKYGVTAAVLADTYPTEVFKTRARKYPHLKFIHGNFGDEGIAHEVGDVDAVLLFDVLLHQVSPDWDRILEMYACHTRCFIIYNPQWIGSDRTVRLLELGEEGYFQNVPHTRTEELYAGLFQKLDTRHPDHDRPWRDVFNIWQWGITDVHLRSKVETLGFKMQLMKMCERWSKLKNFENHAFVFCK